MKIFYLFSIVTTFLLVNACQVIAQKDSEVRNLSGFSTIKTEHGIDLTLIKSQQEKVKIDVERFDLEEVITEVKGGVLYIDRESKPFSSGSIDVVVHYINLERIEVSGGSDVESENIIEAEEFYIKATSGSDLELDLNVNYLECELSSGSDADLKGNANVVRLIANGGSDIDANNLQVETAILKLNGGSDVELYATEVVEIEAHGGSDVEIKGGATIAKLNNDRSSDIEVK